MNASEVSSKEYLPYYANYIKEAGLVDLIDGLENGFERTLLFFKSIPDDKLEYQYATHKWTIKEIIQHLIDTERIMAYRALRFAREDKTPLPSFEENSYAKTSFANTRSKENLIEEYTALKNSTVFMFKSFSKEMLKKIGVASNGEMSVRALGFVIIGHESHHCRVIRERYL